MNKKILTSYILFSFALFVYFTKSDAHTKIRDNYLYFTKDAHSVSFTAENHCILRKQPYQTPDGSQAQKAKKGVGIDIKAGRHSSLSVVHCIQKMFGSINVQNAFSKNFTVKNRKPSTLNFATKGNLTIDGKTFDNIVLAQGPGMASNNWWFGGFNCKNPSKRKDEVNCTATDGTKWCFIRGFTGILTSNSPDHVKVEEHPCDT